MVTRGSSVIVATSRCNRTPRPGCRAGTRPSVDRVSIHPSAVVSTGVELGVGVVIGPQAVVLGPCRLGDGVRIGPGCVIGSPPELTGSSQNLAWADELDHFGVDIGARTVVREMCSVQQGSQRSTVIGMGCWLLTRSYVAHDCEIGDGVTLSAGTALGGHAQIGDSSNIGMNATIHQRRIVGPGVMVGMSAAVTRDVPPYAKVYGCPARLRGANAIAMSRHGIPEDDIWALDEAYRSGRTPAFTGPTELGMAWEWWSARTG
jgi:UDP-N-acetylglucosamine acyltransferase